MNEAAENRFVICILAALSLYARPLTGGETGRVETEAQLQIYLPRQVTVEDASFTVGQVGIVRGKGPLQQQVSEVELASFSMPGQQVTIERPLLLSRLASAGIDPSRVKLTGARKTTVKRKQQVIRGSEFVELALSFLRKALSPDLDCSFNVVRTPQELVLPGACRDIELSTRVVDGSARNRPRVDIDVLADGKLITRRRVAFAVKYNRQAAVARMDIAKGAVIRPEDVRIEIVPSDYPQRKDWSPPYGRIATCAIAANSVISPQMATAGGRQTVVKRNENVIIRIEMPGLLITAVGKALQDGKTGESIRVRNADSKMIIWARVNEDGTVRPIF